MGDFPVLTALIGAALIAFFVIRLRDRRRLALAVGPKLGAFRVVSDRLGLLGGNETDSQLIASYGKLLSRFDDPHAAAMENWVRIVVLRRPFEDYTGEAYSLNRPEQTDVKPAPITEEEVLEICRDFKLEAIRDLVVAGVVAHEVGQKYVDRLVWTIRGFIAESGQREPLPGFEALITDLDARMIVTVSRSTG